MMPRVLHVIDHSGDGGAQVVVLHLVRALADSFAFAVAVLGRSGRFSGAYGSLGVPVIAMGNRTSRWNPWPMLRLVKLINQQRFDLVHTHLFRSNILGTLAAKWGRTRTILHDHCGVYPHALRYYFPNGLLSQSYIEVYKRILRVCDRVVVLTEEDARSYLKLYSLEPHKITVLPNAVDLTEFKSSALPSGALFLREQLGLSNGTRLVVMIGRLDPVKDWITFLKVAQRVQQLSDQPCAFLVVGSGSEEQNLRRFVNDHQLKQVFFLGYRADIPRLLQQVDVLLLTSRREAFPVVLLEAMASGCPVVATRSGGPQSILTHEVDGLLGQVGDVCGLSNEVLRLLHDKALNQRLTSNARQTVLHHYDLKKVSIRMAAIYKEVLKK